MSVQEKTGQMREVVLADVSSFKGGVTGVESRKKIDCVL